MNIEQALKEKGWKYVKNQGDGIEYKTSDIIKNLGKSQKKDEIIASEERFIIDSKENLYIETYKWIDFNIHKMPKNYKRITNFQMLKDDKWTDVTSKNDMLLDCIKNETKYRYRTRMPKSVSFCREPDILTHYFLFKDGIWWKPTGFNENTKEYFINNKWLNKYSLMGLKYSKHPM